MQAGALIPETINDIDDYSITFRRSNLGYGPFSVDANGWPIEGSIGICCYPCYVEVVGDRGSMANQCQGQD